MPIPLSRLGLSPAAFAFNTLTAFLNRRSARIAASAESALSSRFAIIDRKF